MAKKTEQIAAKKSTIEQIMDEAERLAVKGFTVGEMAERVGIKRDLAASLIYKCRIRNEIIPIASKFRVANGSRQQVFKFHRRSELGLPFDKQDPKAPVRNLFDFIERYGHDEDWTPKETPKSTIALPGSPEKIEILRRRLEEGKDLWNDDEDVVTAYARCEPMVVRTCQ